jgi:CHAD domain-containing protein
MLANLGGRHNGIPPKSLTHLKHELESHTTVCPDSNAALKIEKAFTALRESVRSLLKMRLEGDGYDAVGKGLKKSYRRARRRMKAAFAGPTESAFHSWRISVKQLFYQLQWLEPVWPGRFQKMIRKLHRLEQKLGFGHDIAIMEEMLLSPPGGFVAAAPSNELENAAGKRCAHLRKRCQSLGKNLFRQKPGAFAKQWQRHWDKWR